MALLIANPRERRIVQLADLVSRPLRWLPARRPPTPVRRVLLMRLERIGDLLMTLEAISDARRAWPDATLDLAVGSWNEGLARMVPGIHRVHTADLPWLSRGERPTSWSQLVHEARRWGRESYDVVINLEPDIRTNALAWLTGAPVRVGYGNGGGQAFLTRVATYDPGRHGSENARNLVAHASGAAVPSAAAPGPRLAIPEHEQARAIARLGDAGRPWIGVHANGGRESKQWHLDRFAAVARALHAHTGGTIVLTGGEADAALVGTVARAIADVPHVSVVGHLSIPELGALIGALDLFVTGDTGPMHIAGAVETPVVALFGPSDPARYGPRARHERIVRVQIPCSPCGMVRLPPERCRGHVPDCMDAITVEMVVSHARDLLALTARERSRPS